MCEDRCDTRFMDPGDTRKAFLTAQRAYERAMRANSCSLANNNLRLGQKWGQRGYESMRKLIPEKLEYRHYSQTQRHLLDLWSALSNYEMNAHVHRLDKCNTTMLKHEQRYWEDRIKENASEQASRAVDRHYRKRPKKRK
jgi:hypothetical protein